MLLRPTPCVIKDGLVFIVFEFKYWVSGDVRWEKFNISRGTLKFWH